MVRIGEDRSERLDYIPARYQVIVTVRKSHIRREPNVTGNDAGLSLDEQPYSRVRPARSSARSR